MVKKERTPRCTSPFLIFVKDEGNINQAIRQDLPTLYSARKRKLSAYVAGGSSTAMTGCSLSAGLITLTLLSAPH